MGRLSLTGLHHHHMLEILSLTIPFFAIILIGSLARYKHYFSDQDGQMLARFAFFVALPPFMLVAITATDVTAAFHVGFIIRYEIGTIMMFVLSAFFVRLFLSLTNAERGLFCLNTAYPNYGYICVPLAILAFGEQAAIPVAMIMVCDTIILMIMTNILSHDPKAGRLSHALISTLKSMLKNPLLMSVIAGFILSACGFRIEGMPDRFLQMLAGAAAPTALFALGITLIGQPIRTTMNEIVPITVLKLIVHPAIIALLFLGWPSAVPIDPLWIQVAILFSCLPIAANVFALSQFYNIYQGRTATTIMLTTIIASISVPTILYLLVTQITPQ